MFPKDNKKAVPSQKWLLQLLPELTVRTLGWVAEKSTRN